MTRPNKGSRGPRVMGRDVLREFLPGKPPKVDEMNERERAAIAFVENWNKAPTQNTNDIEQIKALAREAVGILDTHETLWREWVTRGVPPPKTLLGLERGDVTQALRVIKQKLDSTGWNPYSPGNVALRMDMRRQLRVKRSRRYNEDPFAGANVTRPENQQQNSREAFNSSDGDAKTSFDGLSDMDKSTHTIDPADLIDQSDRNLREADSKTHSGFNPTPASTVSKVSDSFASYWSGLSNVTKGVPSLFARSHHPYDKL